ncbi:hypothetical protein KSF73_10955 [Burkholderiaceae bacterium DAT-1]|nr:hypothetical protein [Burkholderiaceae bacterium DAT-1]
MNGYITLQDLKRTAKHSLRLYFAPLTGAIRGIVREYRLIEREARKG